MDEELPSFAEVSELETRMQRTFDSGPEIDRAEALLAEASEIIRVESGKTWVGPDDPPPRIVKVITLRMADRAIRNPDGFSSESAGDYSYQRNGVGADGPLYLTPWESKVLRRSAGQSGLWTQQVTRGEDWCRGEWVYDQFGLEPFPIGDLPYP